MSLGSTKGISIILVFEKEQHESKWLIVFIKFHESILNCTHFCRGWGQRSLGSTIVVNNISLSVPALWKLSFNLFDKSNIWIIVWYVKSIVFDKSNFWTIWWRRRVWYLRLKIIFQKFSLFNSPFILSFLTALGQHEDMSDLSDLCHFSLIFLNPLSCHYFLCL